jgi:hypothetical protein
MQGLILILCLYKFLYKLPMTKSLQKALSLTTALTVTAAMVAPLVSPVKAASLTDVTVSLSPDTVSTATTMTITFTPATALSDGAVLEVTYDTDFTGGASLTDADITVSGTNISSSTESNFDNGYFKSTLTTSADVTTTVTITIGNTNKLTNPANAGNYNVSVTADPDGSGSSYDTGAGLAYVADDNDVTVTAVVPPVIDMEIYEANSDTTTNTCKLGVLSLNKVNTCSYDVAGATNNASGMTVKVTSDGALDDGSGNDINAVADGTVTAGSEEYGFEITDDGSSDQWDGGSYETSDSAVPTSETTFATTSSTIDGINTQADRLEVTHKASMATDTVSGSYDQVVTYTAYTN